MTLKAFFLAKGAWCMHVPECIHKLGTQTRHFAYNWGGGIGSLKTDYGFSLPQGTESLW